MERVFYENPDVDPSLGLAVTLVLIVVAGMSATAAHVAGSLSMDPRSHRFFIISAAGAAFLSLDDLLSFHESIGLTVAYNLETAPRPERIGHMVLGVYAVAACVYFWYFRDLLRQSAAARWFLATAAALSLVIAGLDSMLVDPPHAVTHPLQLTAAAGLLFGYWALIDTLVVEPSR